MFPPQSSGKLTACKNVQQKISKSNPLWSYYKKKVEKHPYRQKAAKKTCSKTDQNWIITFQNELKTFRKWYKSALEKLRKMKYNSAKN